MTRRIARPRTDVPYLTKKQIEAEAALLLAEYGQDHGEVTAPPVPIDEIIELHLRLTFELRDMRQLFKMADVHGALWINEKTVRVDKSLDPEVHPGKRGRYRFTLAHEGGHWRLHRKHYVEDPNQGALFAGNLGKPAYICRSSEAKKPVEWQADYFAANLLMPREMVRAAWQDWRGGLVPMDLGQLRCDDGATPAGESYDDALMERFCRPLAERFEVSAEAMRYRLEELELLVREKGALLF